MKGYLFIIDHNMVIKTVSNEKVEMKY